LALVLCTGVDRALMETRALLLERAGHTVVQAASEPEVVTACAERCFDVAVIGQMIGNREKRRVFGLVKEHCPGVRILELTEPFRQRALPEADDWLETHSAASSELPDTVARLAAK